MFQYLGVVCLLAIVGVSCGIPIGNEIVEDQQLVLAFVVNRHGERTPDADELSLSNEQEKLKNLTAIEGLEGLTNVGKRRAYQIGKFLRQRYGSQGQDIISSLYLQDQIAIRSTDKERTKMTIQVAMAALYPPETEQQWDEGVGKIWQPVPYFAVPLSEDYLRYYSNCARFSNLMKAAKQESVFEEFRQYDDLIPKLKALTGKNFTENPLLFETLFDLLRSQVGLGLDIPEWAKPLLPRLGEAARLAYRLYFRTDEMKKIGGGVLLNNFVEAATALTKGKSITKPLRLFSAHDFNIGALMEVAKVKSDQSIPEYGAVFALELYKSRSTGEFSVMSITKPLRLFSAHDFNIGALMEVAKVKSDQSIPEYGAVFALELYKSRSTGEFSVMPVYLPQAGEFPASPLHIYGCETEQYCNFEKFKEMTKQYLLPEREFYTLCGIKTEL